ncbi:chemotaxis protein chel [Roseomonas sp. KE2513]|uniref:rod-binding protein n=1 Tax=Roseomonas sp. KE2513 TaxID=2479202 RepID=UPI0018E06259|nr:rod-binding protein [Roseomonas sp. KE2513]MBI0538068.1 chemotaxis protein chel [Roseomonas sp. KE2513]
MNALSPTDGSAIARTARRFEAQALGALLKPVYGEAPKGLLSGRAAEEQWRPMLIEQHAKAWAERGGVGIASAVHAEMLRMQAAAQSGQASAEAPAGGERSALTSISAAPALPTTPQEGARP